MSSVMLHRLMWTKSFYYILAIRLFLSLPVDLTSHFSNFRQLQIPNARTKYYEILLARTKTPHNTTHKITNRYCEFKYHFSTLQKKFRLLLNKGVYACVYIMLYISKSKSCTYGMRRIVSLAWISISVVFGSFTAAQWPLLLTWFNFNPSMDK